MIFGYVMDFGQKFRNSIFFSNRFFLDHLGRPTKIRRPYEKWSEKNLKNRKIDFLSMKNLNFQILIHSSLKSRVKLIGTDSYQKLMSHG